MKSSHSSNQNEQMRKAIGSYAQAGAYISSGFQFAGTIIVGLFAGSWVDGKLGTSPFLMIVGCLTGSGAGFYYLVRGLTNKNDCGDRPNRDSEGSCGKA